MPGKHSQGREVAAPQTPSWNCLVNTRVVCIEIRGAVGQGLLRVWKDRGKNKGLLGRQRWGTGAWEGHSKPQSSGTSRVSMVHEEKDGRKGEAGSRVAIRGPCSQG